MLAEILRSRCTPARQIASLLAVVTTLAAAAPAAVADRRAISPVTGMEATMSGAQLAITPGARVSSAFLRSVQGRPVTVACFTGAEGLVNMLEGDDMIPDGDFDVSFLGGPAQWPAGSTSLAHRFARDVSATVDGCVVGRNPAVAATFGFDALGRAVLLEDVDEQKLTLVHHAAKLLARGRTDRRFPASRRLAADLARSEPQLEVAHAPTVRRARRNDVVYVVGSGTSIKRVELAYRRNDGQPARLVGRRRGEPVVSAPDESDVPLPVPDGEDVARRLPRIR